MVEITNPIYTTNKIGRAIVKGKCPSCNVNVQKILKQSEIPTNMKKKGGSSMKSRKSRSSKSKKRSGRRSRSRRHHSK